MLANCKYLAEEQHQSSFPKYRTMSGALSFQWTRGGVLESSQESIHISEQTARLLKNLLVGLGM